MSELIAGPRALERSAFAGAGLLEDIDSTCASLAQGDWVASVLGAGGVAMSTIAAVADPIGTALSAGIGWVIEHLEPLKDWLEKLTGDEAAVAGFADTWIAIGKHVDLIAQDLSARMQDLADMSGTFADAVRRELGTAFDGVAALGRVSGAVSMGFEIASSLVGMVYGIVRDAIADIVAKAVVWVAELVLTIGLGTPVVIAQVVTTVGDWAANIFPKLRGLVESIASVQELARSADRAIGSVASTLSERAGTARAASDVTDSVSTWATRHAGEYMTAPQRMDTLFSTRSAEEIVGLLRSVDASNVNFAEGMGALITNLTSVGKVRSVIAMLWADGNGEAAQQLQDALDQHQGG